MATAYFTAPHDTLTLDNFLNWAGKLEQALAACGLVQTGDTGQVQLTTVVVSITATQLSSNVATYTCPSTTGLRVGQSIAVTGLSANAAVFNITGDITALTAESFSLSKTNAAIALASDSGTGTVAAKSTALARGDTVYQMWRFNDSLQATTPVYLKLTFGSYNNIYGYKVLGPLFWIGVGTGTDGAGTLYNGYVGGSTTKDFSASSNENSSATITPTDCYVAGDAGRLTMLLWRNASFPVFYNIERTKDAAGNDTSAGVQTIWSWGIYTAQSTITSYKGFDLMTPSGQHYVDTSNIPCISFSNSATLQNQTISIFPLFSPYGGIQSPMLGCLSGKVSDYGELDQFTYEMYTGKSVNYLVSTLTNSAKTQQQFGTGTNNALIVRYD